MKNFYKKVALTLSFIVLTLTSSVSAKQKGELIIIEADKKQGDFYQVYVKDRKKKPRIWFNSKEYEMFAIEEPEEFYEWSPVNKKARERKSYKYYRALIPIENLTKPGTYSIKVKEDNWERKEEVSVADNKKPISKITLDPDKSGLSATQKELREIGSGLRTRHAEKYWQGKFIYPSNAPKSSPFGVKRSYNGAPVSSYHKGLDFAGKTGSPVVAPADGVVVVAGKEKDGFVVHGNAVILDHGHYLTSIYMHLSKIDVKLGDKVKQGEKIGEVGHTGISTGPHLHWGTYLYGVSTDPEQFVRTIIH